MITIYNKIIPFKGYKAINILGILFVRGNLYISDVDINHEAIHTALMKELLYIGFYIAYLIEWLWRYLFSKDRFTHSAYRNISFEQEAYNNEWNLNYLNDRKHYAEWL